MLAIGDYVQQNMVALLSLEFPVFVSHESAVHLSRNHVAFPLLTTYSKGHQSKMSMP